MELISVLNIGAGKDILKPIGYPIPSHDKNIFQVNVDNIYNDKEIKNITDIEQIHKEILKTNPVFLNNYSQYYSNMNAFEFLDKYKCQFDNVIMYRFMEHISRSNLLYFIYLLSTIVKKGGHLDIIVPDYSLLAKRLLEEKVGQPGWENEDIILTTEFCNEPGMPHASVWTEERAKYYLQLEKRFNVIKVETPFIFDGRDIYMRVISERN